MKQLVDGKQMKELDGKTIHEKGVPSLVLMERAALAVYEEAIGNFCLDRVLILCGSGNNGADGMAVGRLLHLAGYDVDLYLAGKKESFTQEAALQWQIAKNYEVPEVKNPDFLEYTTIIDAIFGVGLSRPVQGSYLDLIEKVNAAKVPVLAVDMPSGIDGGSGAVLGCAIRAAMTVTFAYGKLGLYLYPGAGYAGQIRIRDVGIYGTCENVVWQLEAEDVKHLPKRVPDGNKGTFGKVLVVAGNEEMTGAAYFAAKAALLSGCGMVKILSYEGNRGALAQLLPEAMFTAWKREDSFQRLEEICQAAMGWADVILIGPGIGTDERAYELLQAVLSGDDENGKKPLIVDADGLNLLTMHPELTERIHRPCVLTPHMGEMARLSGVSIGELKNSPREIVGFYQARYPLDGRPTIVLKDARTWVLDAQGSWYLNILGNAGMATAGSGDVLAGIIAGLTAQGLDSIRSAPIGVCLHAMAGDYAAGEHGEASLLASSILEAIEQVRK